MYTIYVDVQLSDSFS